jgi:hypothetical protein
MSKLEAVFRIRLSFPLLAHAVNQQPAVITFADTNNSVSIEYPKPGPAPEQPALNGFDEMVLRVSRECTAAEDADVRATKLTGFQIDQDAARAFWQFFEAIRAAALRLDNTVFMYPVVPTHDIQANPLVRRCSVDWTFDGQPLVQSMGQRGVPAIYLTDLWWSDAVDRLKRDKPVPVYTRFALDATYFAEHDPTRGIIMACAAWETALRYYLAEVASKQDPAYLLASSQIRSIPNLRKFAEVARGCALFQDAIDQTQGFERQTFEHFRQRLDELPSLRNKLLHQGKIEISETNARGSASAVLTAIEWLFGTP